MHEDNKFREADYFLAQMGSTLENPEVFRFNLSAFLSATRSAAQYARKEARAKNGGLDWYNGYVTQDKFIRFFADRRNENTHDQLIQLDGQVDVYAKDGAQLRERILVEKFDREGNLIEVTEGDEAVAANPDAEWTPDFAFVPHYRFAEWTGAEEIPELCEWYVTALKKLVEEGRERGFLTAPEHAA